jgi:inner membrane protein
MASVGHIAVGMAAARVYHNGHMPRASSMALWSALSLLPDIDVIGFALGVPYADPWGHRGATHSLTLSVAVGVAIGLAAPRFKRPAVRTALVAIAVLVSHALLDTMTDGGLGCALLWPFSSARYFAPWRPIPVAPIGFGFFTPYGAIVALTELLLFSPALLVALRSQPILTKPVAGLLAGWLVSVSLLSYSDASRDAITGFLLREDTAYTSEFSETAFRSITPGRSESDVRPAPQEHACLIVRFEGGVVVTTHQVDACRTLGIVNGLTPMDVNRRLGSPSES